ncbi:hypothetical protein QBC43DRAFT_10285 [Cladorrhinum sp. PSN259]|nr:hypothetical protein QBC43DRAFT_10285 [Cladorrhinum sp. PSN259]
MLTFNELPLEMVEAIIGALCPRCNQRSRRSLRLVHTLFDLCLTSRLLKQVATPHLYHRPSPNKWHLLAGTLIARPDLASQVKQLLIPADMSPYFFRVDSWDFKSRASAVPPEVAAYCDALLQKSDWYTPDPWDYMSLLASLCPNLEKLETQALISPFYSPRSLLNLKRVNITNMDSDWNFGALLPLLDAAPNIERIIVDNIESCSGLEELTLPNLTHVVLLVSLLPADDLARLFIACPNLQMFEYECGAPTHLTFGETQYQFDAIQARDRILDHAKNLEYFWFNIAMQNQDYNISSWVDIWGRDEMIEPLRKSMEEHGIEFDLVE